ncbi:hypothetical protein IAT40_002220 [Kwoniella sp. CBS 6097]
MSAPISFTPRHAHPFTLEEAMQLEVDTLVAEINRLRNSISHLRESQAELNEFLHSDEGQSDPLERSGQGEISKAVKENEDVISSQNERIALITIALSNKLGSETRLEHYGLKIDQNQDQKNRHVPISADSAATTRLNTGRGVNVDGLDAVRALSRTQLEERTQSQQEAQGTGVRESSEDGVNGDQQAEEGGLHL